jgi:hypothetical protein
MPTDLDQRQPLYGLIGILVMLFGLAVTVWLVIAGMIR